MKKIISWISGIVGAGASSLGIASASTGFCLSCVFAPISGILALIGVSIGSLNNLFLFGGIGLVTLSILMIYKKPACKECKIKN